MGVTPEDKRAAASQGLLSAGLGILANNYGNYGALGPALGKGGLLGIETYQNQLANTQEAKKSAFATNIALRKAYSEDIELQRKNEADKAGQEWWASLPQSPAYQQVREKMGPSVDVLYQGGMYDPDIRKKFAEMIGREPEKINYNQAFLPDGTPNKAYQDYEINKSIQSRAPAQPPAVSASEVVDPNDPTRTLRIDARTYKGGSLGSVGVIGVSGKTPETQKRLEKSDLIEEKRKKALESHAAQSESVLSEIADAKKLVGFNTAGLGGLLKFLPSSDARDLDAKLTSIKANLGFDRLQQMRDASPTGGALGQVAVQELVALQATVASLDQLQSRKQLSDALAKIEGHYKRWAVAVERDNELRNDASPPDITPPLDASPPPGAVRRIR